MKNPLDPDAGDGSRLEVVDDLERALSLPHDALGSMRTQR